MRTRPSLIFSSLLATLLVLCAASVAFAQALVIVEVRTPSGDTADGTVTLRRQGEGPTYSCTTRRGTCRIAGVPGGLYKASLAPTSGEAPPDRQVMIPFSGTATLRVATR